MESVVRAAAIYIVILVIVRVSGRRTLAQMTPFDLVLILLVAQATQQALLGDDFSLINAVVLTVTLFAIDIGLSYIKLHWPAAERLLDGAPTILVSHGKADRRALARSRMQLQDVLEAAREKQGLERLDQIEFAILETGGEISIVPKADAK